MAASGGKLLLKQLPWGPEAWRSHLRQGTEHPAPPSLTFLVLLLQDDLHGGATSSLGFEAPGNELQGGAENGGRRGSEGLPAHRFPRALVLRVPLGTGREKNRTQTQAVLEKNLTVLSVRMGRFRDLLSACHLKGPEQFVPMSYTPVTS